MDDTNDSVHLIRVRGHTLLLPRLVFDDPGSIRYGRARARRGLVGAPTSRMVWSFLIHDLLLYWYSS